MIAKHVPMRTVKKSDFASLVQYLSDPQKKLERVNFVTTTNCLSDDIETTIEEVISTQSCNRRAESDKTYHLIVSFRAGEHPDAETLRAIESRICEGLGYGDHQRVSALHTDTDNVHLHIAINKIHPTRFTIHTPYNDHKTLSALCERLERDYGLEPDNHQAQKTGAENRAGDMERHAGVESLLGWIKRECLNDLKAAKNWTDFRSVLADNGLTMMLRGNGFVVTDGAGTIVKGSSVAREFSKAKLEARFGPFESAPPEPGAAPPARRYASRPLRVRVDTTELYARYQAEQQLHKADRAAAWVSARDRRLNLVETAKRTARLKRAVIKLMGGSVATKRMLYAMTAKSLRANIDRVSQQYRAERTTIHKKHQRQAWADWLRTQAVQGDRGALEALRARPAAQTLSGNTVTATGARVTVGHTTVVQDSITKKGTAIYAAGQAVIRDDGKRLKVSKGLSHHAAYTALRMAMDRYGSHLSVTGADEFKAQIVRVAALAQLAVTFDDPELERRRQALMTQPQPEITTHGRTNDRGRGDRSGISATGSAAGDGRGRGRGNESGDVRAVSDKPNVGRVGRKPPPDRQNRLRNLSQLGVVRLADRGEVLLPGHVPGHLEHAGTQSTDALRRSTDRPGLTDAAWAAADAYIQERNRTRLYVVDIPKHNRYTDAVGEAMTYGGLRTVDGQTLALLGKDDQVFVLPVDDATAMQLRRKLVGAAVSIVNGTVQQSKGRTR